MIDYESIAISKPIDKKTSLTISEGEHFSYFKNKEQYSSTNPIECINFNGSKEDNLKGLVFNKFTVIGYLGKRRGYSGSGSWLVKCSCGVYENRRKKALYSQHSDNRNQCLCCDKLELLRDGRYKSCMV